MAAPPGAALSRGPFGPADLWGMDPADAMVAKMIERCLAPRHPDKLLDIELEALHPAVGPLQIHVPPGYIPPEHPQAAPATPPPPMHDPHLLPHPGGYHPAHPHAHVPPGFAPVALAPRNGFPPPQTPALPTNPPAQPAAAPPGAEHPAQKLYAMATRAMNRLDSKDSRVHDVRQHIKQALVHLCKYPAADVQRGIRFMQAQQAEGAAKQVSAVRSRSAAVPSIATA